MNSKIEKLAALQIAAAEYAARRPDVKCAVEGCPNYRQAAWDKIRYTPAPPNWKCSRHEVEI